MENQLIKTPAEKFLAFQKKVILAKSGIEVKSLYNTYSSNYDQDLNGFNYLAPREIAKLAAEYITPEQRESIEILDVGSGTGRLSPELKQYGFNRISALDPCEDMLKYAKEKNLYQEYFPIFLEEYQQLPKKFDLVVSSGVFTFNHIGSDGLPILEKILSEGGILVIFIQEDWYEQKDFAGKIEELEKSRKLMVLANKIEVSAIDEQKKYHAHFLVCKKTCPTA